MCCVSGFNDHLKHAVFWCCVIFFFDILIIIINNSFYSSGVFMVSYFHKEFYGFKGFIDAIREFVYSINVKGANARSPLGNLRLSAALRSRLLCSGLDVVRTHASGRAKLID